MKCRTHARTPRGRRESAKPLTMMHFLLSTPQRTAFTTPNMMEKSARRSLATALTCLVLLVLPETCFSLLMPTRHVLTPAAQMKSSATASDCNEGDNHVDESSSVRRNLLSYSVPIVALLLQGTPAFAAADTSSLKLIEEARRQLDSVPKLIDNQKWDSVRAILITPPLSECWASKNTKLLKQYAESVDDDFAALEAREEAVNHLRFLDMAVYNNVFNPIASEGTAGATKELVRSYYEDPINEWKASVAALDELIQLGKQTETFFSVERS